jgi:hypothetical protein
MIEETVEHFECPLRFLSTNVKNVARIVLLSVGAEVAHLAEVVEVVTQRGWPRCVIDEAPDPVLEFELVEPAVVLQDISKDTA